MTDTTFALNPGNFKRVKLIPDGVGNFARGMGMICKFENNFAFGERAWRYSAVINDMMIEKLFIEVSILSSTVLTLLIGI
jgi:peroxiredoxin